MIWDHLDASINTRPTDVSNYQFGLTLNDKPLATVKASGTFDIDSLMLELEHLNVDAACNSKDQAAQLPPVVQDVIQRFQISGQIGLDASAHLPLRQLDRSQFDATLSLKNGECKPPGWIDAIKPAQATLNCTNHGDVYEIKMSSDDGETARMHCSATYNVQTMQLDVPEFEVMAWCSSPQLPPDVVKWVRKNRATGHLKLTGNAHLPTLNPSTGDYSLTLSSQDSQFWPGGFKGPITATDFSFKSAGQSGIHHFDLQLIDGPLAKFTAKGTLDRSLLLNIEDAKINLALDADHSTDQLPQNLAEALAKYKTGGKLAVSGAARIPIKQAKNALYFAAVDLKDGRCQPPDWKGPVTAGTVAFTCTNSPDASKARITSLLSNSLPDRVGESHLWLDNVSADCGKQNVKIENGGEITFDAASKKWSMRKLHGVVDAGNGPGPLDGANVRVWIPFIAAGSGKIGDEKSCVRIALDGGAARVSPQRILIDAINGVLNVTPVGLSSSGLTAKCALGTINTIVNLGWKTDPAWPNVGLNYDGEIHVRDLDLHQLAMQYTTDPKIRQQAFGDLNFNNTYRGSILKQSPRTGPDSVADRLVASGDFDINHGYFLALPILKEVLTAMNNPGASVAGEAAATFEIAHQVVNVTQVAVSSPAIGVQGSGTVGFDQKLNMMFVATPLSDWSKDLKGTGIGMLQGLSDLAGQAQNLVNKAQSVALYQFRVTGNFSNPVVNAVPVPILSDNVGPLFDKMSSNHAEGSMSEELKKQK